MQDSRYSVFVYGTLQPGERFYGAYCADFVLEAFPAIAHGELYDLPLGYPALTVGDRAIQGYYLIFDKPQVLEHLDMLEDYVPGRSPPENEYQRETIEVLTLDRQPLGLAWVYRMAVERAIALGGVVHPLPRWTGRSSTS
jgi:gamma-glutamylcyclotransferase (GGCT)/AIG2-like uncharacterized protein YtfP